MTRAILLIFDSFGIGGAPDAARFGDQGANTLVHIAASCAAGKADAEGSRDGPLVLPNLARLGLTAAAEQSSAMFPKGLPARRQQVSGALPSSKAWERTHPAVIGRLPVPRSISIGAIFP